MLEHDQGVITIDGRDVSRISHDDLRSNIGSVPQDPLIFEGCLRYNLDPLGKFSETELLDMLEQVGLATRYQDKLDDLETMASLSFAEKQMLCLARALLKKSKVVILDEATSSVDLSTEKMMQEIICQKLPRTTVIAVMHRFTHINMYDKVIVVSRGRIVEQGAPRDLLARPDSQFSHLYASEREE